MTWFKDLQFFARQIWAGLDAVLALINFKGDK
jgi:hypothetical protein